MRRLPTLLLSCALLACRGGGEVELLTLSELSAEAVEPGAQLSVAGEGLPVGRSGEVTLRGTMHRPGAPPRRVETRTPGRAVSDDRVTFTLDERAFSELGEHGSFAGELSLAFEAHAGGDRISGRAPAQLDLVQPMARGPAHRHGLRERASAVLDFVGIVPMEESSTLSGLEVDWAAPGSPAERAGIQHGDVIVSAAGVQVHALGDLAPPPGSAALQLRVRTPPHREPRGLSLSLAGLDAPVIDVSELRLSVLLCFVVSCLLLVSPLPAPGAWLARAWVRLREAPRDAIGLWGGPSRARPERGGLLERAERIALRWLVPLSASLAAVLMVVVEPAGLLRLRSLSIYLAFAAISVGLSVLSESGGARQRARVGAEVGSRMLVLMVWILCACALSGTRTFDGMVAAQGAWPWQWALFREPALLLSLPLFVVYAARLGGVHASRLGGAGLAIGDASGPGPAARLLVVERVLSNVVLCGAAVAVYAGGWQSPPELYIEHVPARVTGAALFVLKCWGLAHVLRLSRRLRLGADQHWLTTAGLCAGVIALTALGVYLDPSPTLELAVGRALFLAVAIALVIGLLQALLSRQAASEGAQRARAGITAAPKASPATPAR